MTPTIVPTISEDVSFADLRGILSDKPAPEKEPIPEVSEPEAEKPAEAKPEADAEPADKQPEPKEPEEEEIPEGVKKRIAKEAAKAAEIQSRIDRAVSERKAKEAELAKIEAAEKGSEPVKTPESAGKPKRPTFGEAGHESETYAQFEARQEAHEENVAKWVKAEALREFEQTSAARQAQAKAQERWEAAVKKHGTDFPALMEKAREVAPEGLQQAISALDEWDTVAVHLAKNPAKLKELADSYSANPVKAIATLGRIEASLTATKEPKQAQEKPLPEPVAKIGGSASASAKDLQSILEGGSMAQLRAVVKKANSG